MSESKHWTICLIIALSVIIAMALAVLKIGNVI